MFALGTFAAGGDRVRESLVFLGTGAVLKDKVTNRGLGGLIGLERHKWRLSGLRSQ